MENSHELPVTFGEALSGVSLSQAERNYNIYVLHLWLENALCALRERRPAPPLSFPAYTSVPNLPDDDPE